MSNNQEITPWEAIYSRGEQLNRYPYNEIVSFTMRRWGNNGGIGKHALDVGCGSGVHSQFLAERGARVTAFDYSQSAISRAQQLFPNIAINYKVSDFANFDAGNEKFDLVIDRCSSTQSSKSTIHNFYQDLRKHLKPGAQLFWQGFHWDNSGRQYGKEQEDGSWSDFTGGVYENLGSTVFLKEEEIREVFAGYAFTTIRRTHNVFTESGYDDSGWVLEMVHEG